MSDLELPDIDYEAAYQGYLERFAKRFGDRPEGAFVKFGKHMVKRLTRGEFPRRLDQYVHLHGAVKNMLETGSTISDALVLDFVEASAWIGIQAPDMYAMFRGELGDPKLAAPDREPDAEREDTVEHEADTLDGESGAKRSDTTEPEIRYRPSGE